MSLLYDITFPSLPLSSTEASFCYWKERKNARRVVVVVVLVCVCVWGGGGGGDRGLAEWPFPLPCWLFPFLSSLCFCFAAWCRSRALSLTLPASMLIYWNKRKHLQEKRVQLPQDLLGTPTWLQFHCFRTPIWPPWRHVKTPYNKLDLPRPFLYPEIHNTTQHMHFIRWHI